MKLAYYTTGKTPTLTLTLGHMQAGRLVAILPVKGKSEARALAVSHGAKPWNF